MIRCTLKRANVQVDVQFSGDRHVRFRALVDAFTRSRVYCLCTALARNEKAPNRSLGSHRLDSRCLHRLLPNSPGTLGSYLARLSASGVEVNGAYFLGDERGHGGVVLTLNGMDKAETVNI